MKANLFAFYDGYDRDTDERANKIVAQFGGEWIAQGSDFTERDIQWTLPSDRAEEASAALQAAGFRTTIKPNSYIN
jgi:hypothetical protein